MSVEVAFILGMSVILFCIIEIAFSLDPEHYLLKLLMLFFSFYIFIVIAQFGITIGTGQTWLNTAILFYKMMTWLFRFFVTYVGLYFIYKMITQLDLFAGMRK